MFYRVVRSGYIYLEAQLLLFPGVFCLCTVIPALCLDKEVLRLELGVSGFDISYIYPRPLRFSDCNPSSFTEGLPFKYGPGNRLSYIFHGFP